MHTDLFLNSYILCVYIRIHTYESIYIYLHLSVVYIYTYIYTRIDIDRDIDIDIIILTHTSIYILFSEHTTETSPPRFARPCRAFRGISACEKGSVWRQAKGRTTSTGSFSIAILTNYQRVYVFLYIDIYTHIYIDI